MEMKMIRKLAWSFHRTTGLEIEDLIQEACFIWLKEQNGKRYDCRKSAFNTFAYLCMQTHLATIATKEKRRVKTADVNEMLADKSPQPNQRAEFMSELKTLSEDAKIVMRIIFDSPYEFLCITKRRSEKNVVKTLVSKYDLPLKTAKDAVKEIRAMLGNSSG
jgi:DNA-directed RNA polymerase specialized sigma24 family protein